MAEAAAPSAPAEDTSTEVAHNFDLEYQFNMPIPGPLSIQKYRSKRSGMTAYFVDMNTQVINGYFCFGTDQPEAIGIEQLLHQLDSSGGLLPRAMRGDMLRPAWQFHGAENPLADRDESCYVCCALGESAFLGTFSCSLYLLQNLEAVLELHGYPYPYMAKDLAKAEADGIALGDGEGPNVKDEADPLQAPRAAIFDDNEEQDTDVEPQLEAPYYCLSEAGEGAMAWEATLQSMYPGVKTFWNRLLNDGRAHRLGQKMRKCFDSTYRPENMSVIITGAIENREQVLEMLSDHEMDYYETHPNLPPFVKPWVCDLPPQLSSVTNTIRFISRNPMRTSTATICIGWRGCNADDLETSMAIKVLTAHIAVGPLWTKLVTAGHAHRISWCQLEYKEICSLITIHALPDKETVDKSMDIFQDTLKELAGPDANGNIGGGLDLVEIKRMADRVGWHYIRETESDPFLFVAAAIAKAERYGDGSQEQVDKRIFPRKTVEGLLDKPKQYWIELLMKYFVNNGFYATQVVPVDEQMERELRQEEQLAMQERPSSEMQYAEGSRRAASKPRRKAGNAMGEESSVAVDEDGRNNNMLEDKKEEGAAGSGGASLSEYDGPLEEQLKQKPFPFGEHDGELENFEQRMEVTKQFLKNVRESQLKYWNVTSYHTGGAEQHPQFPLNDMPLYTFLDDTHSAFVYMTIALDTTGLDQRGRRLLAPVTAALGAFVCPRPPALDTDAEIEQPNEFNPPLHVADSQVSLGLNGESTQNVFLTIIIRPDKYKWAVGLIHHILYDAVFSTNYLRFIAKEAVRGLAANYRMQKAETPNYECFDSGEINLHGLISLIYKEESNARLFVGRRRLDLMMEYLADLEKQPEQLTRETNETWRKIVDAKKVILQIAGNVTEMAAQENDLLGPWKQTFDRKQMPLTRSEVQLTSEPEVMLSSAGKGVIIELKEPRASCLSLAIPINPNSPDFPKLCIAAQMFSMAQKWIWSCWGLDDVCSPVLRMPCSYANLITLNLECMDVMGSLMAMKMMIKDSWPWLDTLLTATKLMVINDPATLELGAQGSIISALLSHINDQSVESRRTLLKDSMNVSLDDIKEVINKHLVKLFDPASSWCSLMVYKPDNEALIARVEQLGYQLTSIPIDELCTSI